MFGTDGEDKTVTLSNVQTPETTTTTSSEPDSSCATMIEVTPIAVDPIKDSHFQHKMSLDDTTHEVCCML